MKTAMDLAERQTIGAQVRSRGADYCELTKPRLTMLAVMMTLVGFYVGAQGALNLWLLLNTLLGTALVGAGAAALNQFLEREADAKMRRTEQRPIPAGRLLPAEALAFGVACSMAGTVYLAAFCNFLTAALAAICLGSYLFLYTPLKKKTWLCTLIGAVPGALPPVMGWAAVRGEIGVGAWILFLIVFLWQMPHFYAIAWLYRDDYAKGEFRMLPVVHPDGRTTARQIALFLLALVPVSLAPTLLGLAGAVYLAGALVVGIVFAVLGLRFAASRANVHARILFLGSVIYLPVLGLLMIVDKV